MEKTNNKIFIYSPGYNKSFGDNSITHYLCEYLNKYSIFESYLIEYNEDTKLQMGSDDYVKENFILNEDLINIKLYNYEFEINYENDFVIYNESIFGNPLNFKNVIRWILYFPNKSNYESYLPDDILLFYVEPYLRNLYELGNINYYHSDIIDYLNDDLNDTDLFFSILDDNTEKKMVNNLENIKNIKKLEDKILRRIKFEKVKFTEPLVNFYNKNGLSFNEIKCDLCLTNFSIEIEFQIKSFDFEYQNLFDLNYKIMSKGPRLEINSNGILGIVFTPDGEENIVGHIIEHNIEINKKYFLKFNFQNNKFLFCKNSFVFKFIIDYIQV